MRRLDARWWWASAAAGLWLVRRGLRARRRFDLAEKTVVVTGGSRGLGLQLSHELGRHGAKLALCARDEAELEAARKELTDAGIEVFVAACDVSDQASVERFVDAVHRALGPIDALVNNAGVIQVGPAETMKLEDFEQAMRIHFYGPLYLTWAIVPELQSRRCGRVVNISSIGGKIAVPHLLPYSASKFALTGFSSGLRAELAKDDVYVTTVCPGLMRTGSTRRAFFKGKLLTEYKLFHLAATLPLVTMRPDRAAKKIVRAMIEGRAELVLTPQAKLAARVTQLLPELSSDLLSAVARLLPSGGSKERVEGADLEPPRGGGLSQRIARFWALRLNEYAPGEATS